MTCSYVRQPSRPSEDAAPAMPEEAEVLGLDDVVGYRVGELPGRVYIDVAA